MNKINKYWTETAASREFGIPSSTLGHASTRGDIETATTACGLPLLYLTFRTSRVGSFIFSSTANNWLRKERNINERGAENAENHRGFNHYA